MAGEAENLEELLKEVAYYKRQIDELAGTNLKADYEISGLRHELKQKRQGFALLSELQGSIGSQNDVSTIFEIVARAINSKLGMDRTVVLCPTEDADTFRAVFWLGFPNENAAELAEIRMPIAASIAAKNEPVLFNGATPPSEFSTLIGTVLKMPYFICAGVAVDDQSVGVLVSGRLLEKKPLYPPLDQGDIDTFRAIAGLISAIVQNMKVAVLQETDRLKTQFFANISHEFRTPIALTIGPLESLLKSKVNSLPDGLRSPLEGMWRNQVRLLGLVNQILDIAKIESGTMNLSAEPVEDMNRFVSERAEQFLTWAEKRGFRLKIELDSSVVGQTAFIDREKFDRILLNLLSNACKFTKSGSVTVCTDARPERLEISVRDTGIGIKRSELPHVFDRFRQADGSASREYAGTGLGLSLVKELVELHGGAIEAQSEYGKGTVFTISIPWGSAHLGVHSIIASTASDTTPSMNSQVADIREGRASEDELNELEALNRAALKNFKKGIPGLLFADDNRDMRDFVSGILSQHYNVFLAAHGRHGLDCLRNYPIDLVLSDMMMPVMAGVEFCRSVRANKKLKSLPFVLLTAKTDFDSKMVGLEEGADDYLGKPFSEVELLTRIRNMLRLREQHIRIQKELQAARLIQQSLLPSGVQRFAGGEISAVYLPCDELSGDFYDVIPCEPWIYFYVADVTSHGTAAAQVTYLLKQLFQSTVVERSDLAISDLMALICRKYRDYGLNYGVGIQLARYRAADRLLEYVFSNAPCGVMVVGDGVEGFKVDAGPSFDGDQISESMDEFPVFRTNLDPGQRLYLFSDGCYEFDDLSEHKPFGLKKFRRVLGRIGVDQWEVRIMEELARINGGEDFADDLTILRFLEK